MATFKDVPVTQVRLQNGPKSMVGFVDQGFAKVGLRVLVGAEEWEVTHVYASWPKYLPKEHPNHKERALGIAWWFKTKKVREE